MRNWQRFLLTNTINLAVLARLLPINPTAYALPRIIIYYSVLIFFIKSPWVLPFLLPPLMFFFLVLLLFLLIYFTFSSLWFTLLWNWHFAHKLEWSHRRLNVFLQFYGLKGPFLVQLNFPERHVEGYHCYPPKIACSWAVMLTLWFKKSPWLYLVYCMFALNMNISNPYSVQWLRCLA